MKGINERLRQRLMGGGTLGKMNKKPFPVGKGGQTPGRGKGRMRP